jgi:transmembrane sensor
VVFNKAKVVKNYSNYSVNDFVLDEFFHSWVTKADDHANSFWSQWLKDHPERKEIVEEARSIVKHLAFSRHTLCEQDVTLLWNRIKAFDTAQQDIISVPKRAISWWYKVAASLILFTLLMFAYQYWPKGDLLTYHTAYGETKVIVLPDSSTVVLNSNSTLKFPRDWEKQTVREIWLNGEAYFSVIHKINNQPFHVYTEDGLAVEVLGTTFNVYHRIDETKVVLNTGRIRLQMEDASQDITMQPGDFVEYKQKSFSKRVVNPDIYSAWTENKLILDHTSLREMVAMLHNNYGVEIVVDTDSLLNQTMSGSMPLTDVENLVNNIAQTFQLKVVKQRNKFLLHE